MYSRLEHTVLLLLEVLRFEDMVYVYIRYGEAVLIFSQKWMYCHVCAIHLEILFFYSIYTYLQVGRYWALVIGLSLYVIGFTLLTIMASGVLCHWSPASSSCVSETYGILICVGIAGGTVRANIPSFGAEQVILL